MITIVCVKCPGDYSSGHFVSDSRNLNHLQLLLPVTKRRTLLL